tara:strand:+ start:6180 stop:7055 length:876 start_codon:yes stop_codon:yes gene_type:complete
VARIIDMPTTPNFIRSNFKLVRTVGTVVSPYTGKIRTQEYDGVFWEATVTLPPMRRDVAVNWQSFLLELNGPVNHFKFADPDALTNTGTYDGTTLLSDHRISASSQTLTFNNTNNVITGSSNVFDPVSVGDFIFITGAEDVSNNGSHKITTKTDANTIRVDTTLTTRVGDSGITIKCNQKGATGLNLDASSNSATGTIKKGDYLQITGGTSATGNPVQYVMATEDATLNVNSGADHYGVRIQPKLRTELTNNNVVRFATPKGLFRLAGKDVDWDADQISNYGISFSCIEVV